MGITNIMHRALNGAWLRHELLSNNIANSETPGYKARELDFQSYLNKAKMPNLKLVTTNLLHVQPENIPSFAINIDKTSVTPDGNSVDVDKEMADISANALYYSAISRQLTEQFSLLRKAITEGRR